MGLMWKVDIDCRDEKDTIIIDLSGQLDVCNSHKINLFVMPIWNSEFNRVIKNLGKFTYLDSYTVSVLIYYCQTLKDEGRFVLEGFQGSPKELFDMAQLHDVFQIFSDVPKVME